MKSLVYKEFSDAEGLFVHRTDRPVKVCVTVL